MTRESLTAVKRMHKATNICNTGAATPNGIPGAERSSERHKGELERSVRVIEHHVYNEGGSL